MNYTQKCRAAFLALAVGLISTSAFAQSVGQKIDTTAKKVGNATASTAVKGASVITDKVYKGKEGPKGETVYINKYDHKYIVNSKGRKVYLKPSQIRDKQ
jgi:hypothetical protein